MSLEYFCNEYKVKCSTKYIYITKFISPKLFELIKKKTYSQWIWMCLWIIEINGRNFCQKKLSNYIHSLALRSTRSPIKPLARHSKFNSSFCAITACACCLWPVWSFVDIYIYIILSGVRLMIRRRVGRANIDFEPANKKTSWKLNWRRGIGPQSFRISFFFLGDWRPKTDYIALL